MKGLAYVHHKDRSQIQVVETSCDRNSYWELLLIDAEACVKDCLESGLMSQQGDDRIVAELDVRFRGRAEVELGKMSAVGQ